MPTKTCYVASIDLRAHWLPRIPTLPLITPAGVIADITGAVYVSDQGNGLIRKITVGQTR